MLRRRFVSILPLLAVLAASAARSQDESARKEVGQYVDLRPVGLPIIDGGRLLNYVFVNVRINLTARADPSRWRAKEPFFRDALVRMSHETPFGAAGNPNAVDVPRLTAALTRAAVSIAGPGVVQSVVVTSQTPSRQVPRPAP